MFEYDRNRVKRMSDYANGLFAEIIEQYRNGIVDNEFVKYAEAISKANHDYIESLCEAAQNELEKELDAKNIAAIEKVVNGTVNEIIEKFTDAFVDEFTKEMEAEEATGAEDPETIGAAEAEKGKDMESAQYDEESDGYKYSAAEIAQKLNVLSQYCDIELKDTCTIADIAEFLENVHLDANGNVWLMVQIDEYTFKRFRLNREAAGQITM